VLLSTTTASFLYQQDGNRYFLHLIGSVPQIRERKRHFLQGLKTVVGSIDALFI